MGKLPYLMDDIIESVLIKENTSKKTTRHAETKIRTWILLTSCLPYSFIIKKFFTHLFCRQWRFVETTCFFKQCNPIGDLSSREGYFSHSVIWPSLNTKIFVKTNSKRKKYERFFQKIVFLFNNFVFKLVNLSSYKASCK